MRNLKPVTVSHDDYQQVAKFKRTITIVKSPTTRKLEHRFRHNPNKPKDERRPSIEQPMQILNTTTGEVLELSSVEKGCGITVGEARELKWKPEHGRRARGGHVVTAIRVQRRSDGDYDVTFASGVVPLGAEILLASGAGYTGDATATIDDEAPVFPSADVDRVMADAQHAARARAREKLNAAAEVVEDPAIDKRRRDRIMREIELALAELGEEAA